VTVLVAGEEELRATIVDRLEERFDEVAEADPMLGNVVNLIRVEGDRFDAVVFAGHGDPVTVEALPLVRKKAIVVDEPLPDADALARLVRGVRDS
jgi:hypothetical protein